jgi:hypothetical protein
MGAPSALPSALAVNTPARVTITIPIPDSTLISGGVNLLRLGALGQSSTILGQFHDDGLNGDAVAGDKVYSLQIIFNEPAPTTVRLQVSTAFRGLLQRVLSPVFNVAVTTTGVPPLPPDPGPAGLLTVAGVDSDGDGVRDDVQRFIVLTYADSAKTQAATTQIAKSYLAQLVDASNEPLLKIDVTSTLYAVDCLYYTSPATAPQLLNQIEAQVLNTSQRLDAYYGSSRPQGAQFYYLPTRDEKRARCMVNPDSLPN